MSVDLEDRIGTVLRVGSLLSTTLLALGLIVSLSSRGSSAGSNLTNAGLILVLATPVARVVVAMIGFAQQRDWRFVLMTLAILSVLGGSVVASL